MLDGDFSSIDEDELSKAQEKADAAAEAVEALDSDRFAGAEGAEVAKKEQKDPPQEPAASDLPGAISPEAEATEDIAQDDIDSLFG